jgi:formiminoglutamase
MAATIVRNAPELTEDRAAQAEMAKCRVALIGLPDDTGVEYNHGRVGARNGPGAFRAALNRYGVAMPLDEPGNGRAYPRVFDAGDIIVGRNIHETHERVSAVVETLLRRNLFPIAIGGGHDLTFAFVRGVARVAGPMTGAYIDAHLDVRPEVGSGMPFRALLEDHYAANLRCIGLNPLVTLHEHAEYFRSHGGVIHLSPPPPEQMFDTSVPNRSAFLSLDMDAFDGAHCPGVSAVNPCGLSPREVEPLIRAAGRNPAVRCFDIMELNPDVDTDGRSARLAVHMFLTFLRALGERDNAHNHTHPGKGPRP